MSPASRPGRCRPHSRSRTGLRSSVFFRPRQRWRRRPPRRSRERRSLPRLGRSPRRSSLCRRRTTRSPRPRWPSPAWTPGSWPMAPDSPPSDVLHLPLLLDQRNRPRRANAPEDAREEEERERTVQKRPSSRTFRCTRSSRRLLLLIVLRRRIPPRSPPRSARPPPNRPTGGIGRPRSCATVHQRRSRPPPSPISSSPVRSRRSN
mmetsp:Transcript_3705/g.9941  ORF Transcript_3705/g.9941 Transcript_3705/m.9941 type:complete len:205 (+) Transcript_3705:2778-3392(+)